MNKSKLESCLSEVFLGTNFLNPSPRLKSLSTLLAYYIDADTDEEILESANSLQRLLLKIEIVRETRERCAYPKVPAEFHCVLDSRPPVPSFTFSPQIEMPEYDPDCLDLSPADEIADELEDIDVAGLTAYVRQRAIAAGDFQLSD